jgi:hypothetical protein
MPNDHRRFRRSLGLRYELDSESLAQFAAAVAVETLDHQLQTERPVFVEVDRVRLDRWDLRAVQLVFGPVDGPQ